MGKKILSKLKKISITKKKPRKTKVVRKKTKVVKMRSKQTIKKEPPIVKSKGEYIQPTSERFKEEVATSQLSLKTEIEQEKFSTPHRTFKEQKKDLPSSYNKDRLVLMVRDPWWIFAYWEITPQKVEEAKNILKDNFYSSYFALRVYDISNVIFDGTNAHYYFDIPINLEARNWYISLPGDGRSWCVDLGLKGEFGFYTLLRSNPVHCPSSSPSWITDEEWYSPWEDFMRLYATSLGERGTSPVQGLLKKRFEERISSGISSLGFFSGASFRKAEEKKRGFFLEVWTELIVYGRTTPDAEVKVQGKRVELRKDGTFSLRFFLPDSKQVIPVEAISGDKLEKRKITPIVTKETR